MLQYDFLYYHIVNHSVDRVSSSIDDNGMECSSSSRIDTSSIDGTTSDDPALCTPSPCTLSPSLPPCNSSHSFLPVQEPPGDMESLSDGDWALIDETTPIRTTPTNDISAINNVENEPEITPTKIGNGTLIEDESNKIDLTPVSEDDVIIISDSD